MNIISVNGIKLAYTRRGRGTPLILVHGFPLDHTSWNEVAPLLEDRFDVIIPDLRGFGQSTTIESPYSISDMADDIAGLLDGLEIYKAAIAGHSMGGYVSLAFLKNHPKRVSGLGLISSQAAADSPERKDGRYKTAADVAEKGVGVVAEAMTTKLSADARVQEFVRRSINEQGKSAVIGALKAMAERDDMMSHLAALNADFPVALIHGDADVLIPVERSRVIKSILPSAKLFELPGAGHMPMMEFAEATIEGLMSLTQ